MTRSEELTLFFKSIGIQIGISAVCSLLVMCFAILFNFSIMYMIPAFILTIAIQWIVDYMIRSISSLKNRDAEFIADQVLKEAAERQLPYNLNCAYCNSENRVGISFNNENIFNCESCRQPNKVYIQFTTSRITTPLLSKESNAYIEMDEEDIGVKQTSINEPIKMNEK